MADPASTEQAKLLFIHGFGSCGTGNKAETLRQHFGASRLLSPDLPVNPADCLNILSDLISEHQPLATVSSSLGSYYATWLNQHHNMPAILINPAVNPAMVLEPHIGTHRHWCSGEIFELTADHIDQLKQLKRNQLGQRENYLVLLQEGDEVLDYREAVRFYQGQQVIIEQGGNHRFENLHDYLTMIEQFIEQHRNPTRQQDHQHE